MKTTPWLLAGLLAPGLGGRIAAQPAAPPLTNPIDIANEVERLQAENQSLEDQLDPQAELTLLRQQNTELKLRLAGPQTLAELKAVTAQAFEKQPAYTLLRRGPTAESAAALLRSCADPDDPRHAQSLKNLFAARLVLTRLLDDATTKLVALPSTKNTDEIAARQSFAARLAAARQTIADVSSGKDAREDWRYSIRDLLSSLQ
jgi:hypothetical protein